MHGVGRGWAGGRHSAVYSPLLAAEALFPPCLYPCLMISSGSVLSRVFLLHTLVQVIVYSC